MGLDALTRLFGITGSFVSLYALSAWVLSQGGTQLSAVPGLEPGAPAQSAYFAIIVVGFVLLATSIIGITHLHRPTGKTGWRFPIVGLGDTEIENPRAWSVRLYVLFLVLVFFILPAVALRHLNDRLAQVGILWNEALPASATTGVACALPFWPFGACEKTANEDKPAQADAIFAFLAPPKKDDEGKIKPREPGRLWLVSHQCDLNWERGLTGPQIAARFKDGRDVISKDEREARQYLVDQPAEERKAIPAPYPIAVNPPAKEPGVNPDDCAGSRDRSTLCKADESKCRGVTWDRFWSPLLVLVPSILGWVGTFAFFLLWFWVEYVRAEPRSVTGSSDEMDTTG